MTLQEQLIDSATKILLADMNYDSPLIFQYPSGNYVAREDLKAAIDEQYKSQRNVMLLPQYGEIEFKSVHAETVERAAHFLRNQFQTFEDTTARSNANLRERECQVPISAKVPIS